MEAHKTSRSLSCGRELGCAEREPTHDLPRSAPVAELGAYTKSGVGDFTGFNRVQFLAGLETHRFSRSDADLGSSAGISADASFASADTENAESAQFDALARCQSLFQAFEDRVDCCFSLRARQAGALDDLMNDVLFNQWGTLADATEYDCTTPCRGDATDFDPNIEHLDGFASITSVKAPEPDCLLT